VFFAASRVIFRRGRSVQEHPILFLLRLTLVISLLLFIAPASRAQSDIVRARVRSVRGLARIYAGPIPFAPKVNDPLEPGNRIETGLNGRVIISLSDGGQITVLPNSKVTLKNFRDAQSARELLEIVVGRVLVKIHHIGGKPNPYRLNSPAASIAVRGTEFIVDVRLGGETLVLVREGLVEVWPRNNPDNKRLVTPGGRVTVQPGGGISSTFPGPRRSLENVAQNSNDISPIFFSAFPDQHLDSLDNPAYAAGLKEAQGRLLLLPSISEPYYVDVKDGNSSSKGPPRFDYSVSPQLTFFTPIPDSHFVIGGGVSALRTRLQEQINIQTSDSQVDGYEATRLNAINASIVAAYSFGDQGRTSVGIGIDRSSGDEDFSSRNNSKVKGFYTSRYFDFSRAHFERTRLTFGLTRRFSESMKVGIYYRHGFNSSEKGELLERKYNSEYRPDTSFFAAGRASISASSASSELGVRLRGSLTRRLFYGTEGSYLYERVRSRREMLNQPVAYNRYLARRARLGVGLGFFLTSKILLNFDVAGGLFNNSKAGEEPFIPGLNFLSFSALSQSIPRSLRGSSVSAHMAAQANPWRDLILSTSGLTTIRSNLTPYTFNGETYNYMNRDMRALSNFGIGWKFKPNFIAEYLFSIDNRERVPSHSLRLRYTFNLGGTNEK